MKNRRGVGILEMSFSKDGGRRLLWRIMKKFISTVYHQWKEVLNLEKDEDFEIGKFNYNWNNIGHA